MKIGIWTEGWLRSFQDRGEFLCRQTWGVVRLNPKLL